jgi:hypothetical protein
VNGHGVARAKAAVRDAVGMDERGEVERQIRRALFRPPAATHARASARPAKVPAATRDGAVPSRLPDVFPTCRNITTRAGTFGYLRLATFNVEDDGPFVDEFIRCDAKHRLISPAGTAVSDLNAPARCAQRTRRAFSRRGSGPPAPTTGLRPARGGALKTGQVSRSRGVVTDALLLQRPTSSRPLTMRSARSSAWTTAQQRQRGNTPIAPRPATAAAHAAARAPPVCGAAGHAGGCQYRHAARIIGASDVFHETTRRDLLESNADLIAHAIDVLKTQPTQTLTVERASARACRVTTANLDVVDAYLDVHPLVSHRVHTAHFTLDLPRGTGRAPAPRVLRLEGFRKGALVAAARLALR